MIGQTISHYRILGKLGEGGMGVVYKATDLNLDRLVALKFLPPELTRDPAAKARFFLEAKAASALDHPNVCTVHEVNETDDGQLFMAMACYEGETLKEKISQGPLGMDDAVSLVGQIAEGLATAHSKGIIHRDIKPQNIFITREGLVKILDFGLAKLMGQTKVTREGTTLGTVTYMSPEQSSGAEIDTSSDLWSTGVVLYEMITGRVPFKGDNAQAVIYGILSDTPKPVSDLRGGIPVELEQVVNKCMVKDPKQRYQTAGDLLTDLQHLKPESSTAKITIGRTQIMRTKPRRWQWILGLVLTISVLSFLAFRLFDSGTSTEINDIPMLAVLPFENMSPDQGDLLGSGITEDLITRLTRLSGIRVISRVSSRQYRDTALSPSEIAKELGADFIVGGSVMILDGNDEETMARVIPHLIDPQSGIEIWAESYDVVMPDIFTAHSDIAESIVGALKIQFTSLERTSLVEAPTDDFKAYEYYIRGRAHEEFLQGKNAEEAMHMYEMAVALDPDFALAWAQLGKLRTWVVFIGRESETLLTLAEASIRRAFNIDPGSPEAHAAFGYYHYWGFLDYEKAEVQFRQALAAQPSNVQALQGLGLIMRRRGQWEEGLTMMVQAQRLSPREYDLNNDLIEFYTAAGEFESALAATVRNIALSPETPSVYTKRAQLLIALRGDVEAAYDEIIGNRHVWIPISIYRILLKLGLVTAFTIGMENLNSDSPIILLYKAQIFDAAGLEQEAINAYEAAALGYSDLLGKISPEDAQNHAFLGLAYSGLGRYGEAIQAGERALDLMPAERDYWAHRQLSVRLAEIYLRAGKHNAALDILENLQGKPILISLTANFLRLDPLWESLRDNPRFMQLVAQNL